MKSLTASIAFTSFCLFPLVSEAWVCGPTFYGLSSPMVIASTNDLLRQRNEMMRRQKILVDRTAFPRMPSNYNIKDTLDKFQVSIDVPGVKMENINVVVEDGSVLSISGFRESAEETAAFSSKFAQRFSLDPSLDVEKFSVTLQNGVLIVSAPKDLKRIEDNIRKIPITAHEDVVSTKDIQDEESYTESKSNMDINKEDATTEGQVEEDGSSTQDDAQMIPPEE